MGVVRITERITPLLATIQLIPVDNALGAVHGAGSGNGGKKLEIAGRAHYHPTDQATPPAKNAQQLLFSEAHFMPTIKFIKEKKTVEVPAGANLRKEAMRAGVEVYKGIHKVVHCPGFGLCTTCKMRIKNGVENVSKQGLWEKFNMTNFVLHPFTFVQRLGNERDLRLACQTKVYGDVEVETQPEFNWHGERFWG